MESRLFGHHQEEDAEEMSEAERAYAFIAASLQQGLASSPKTATTAESSPLLLSSPYYYSENQDPCNWLAQQVHAENEYDDDDDDEDDIMEEEGEGITMMQQEQEDEEDEDDSRLPLALPPPKRPAVLLRADTPVMSNTITSIQKKQQQQRTMQNKQQVLGTAGSPPPRPSSAAAAAVPLSHHHAMLLQQTPVVARSNPSSSSSYRKSNESSSSSHVDYRRYHEAFSHFFMSKRLLLQRMDLDDHDEKENKQQENVLNMMQLEETAVITTTSSSKSSSSRLAREELRIDLEFLRSLHRLCWDRMPPSSSSSSSSSSNNSNSSDMSDPAQKEGNFWLLVSHLRSLGVRALAWNDDEQSERQHANEVAAYMETLCHHVDATPLELLRALYGEGNDSTTSTTTSTTSPPAVLLRRRKIQQWLHACFASVLPPNVMRPRNKNNTTTTNTTRLSTSAITNQTEGLPLSSNDAFLFRDCLALLLAGRLEHALQLCRDSGLAWRAAAWGGGAPHGYVSTTSTTVNNSSSSSSSQTMMISVGNPSRALWRRMMWLQSEQLANINNNNNPASATASEEEGAIVALLALHVRNALSNACLRTSWYKGLYVALSASLACTEDALLHMHNNTKRQQQITCPGAQYESKEKQNLQATADVPDTERGVLFMLAASPFEEMQVAENDILTLATASFLIGRNAVVEYLDMVLQRMEKNSGSCSSSSSGSDLRFLTHLLLYLDSLSECKSGSGNNNVLFDEIISEWKNQTLFAYLAHLSEREDLWYSLVLYASHLPEQELVEYLPRYLSIIESPKERKIIVQQLRDYLPREGLDAEILRRIVDVVLSQQEQQQHHHQDNNNPMVGMLQSSSSTTSTPTRVDVQKMNSILWLCFFGPQEDEHDGEHDHHSQLFDALVFSNTLLRQFLLADKNASAFMFVEDVLPDQVLQTAMEGGGAAAAGNDEDDGNDESHGGAAANLSDSHARSEFIAYQSYLNAIKAAGNWRDVLASTDAVPMVVDDRIDTSQLNAKEAAIASHMEKRELIKEKRKLSFCVVAAAERAQKSLLAVLEHPGGWLLTDDEVVLLGLQGGSQQDEMVRRSELHALRIKLLPKVAMLYSDVCLQTAAWMHESLNDATERLDCTLEYALSKLDNKSSMSSPSSPLLPAFWTRRALDLAQLVATDSYSIKSACGRAELNELMEMLSEASVADLLYSCKRSND